MTQSGRTVGQPAVVINTSESSVSALPEGSGSALPLDVREYRFNEERAFYFFRASGARIPDSLRKSHELLAWQFQDALELRIIHRSAKDGAEAFRGAE